MGIEEQIRGKVQDEHPGRAVLRSGNRGRKTQTGGGGIGLIPGQERVDLGCFERQPFLEELGLCFGLCRFGGGGFQGIAVSAEGNQLVARGIEQTNAEDHLFRVQLPPEQLCKPLATGRVQGGGGEPGAQGGGGCLEKAFFDAFYPGIEGNKAAFGSGGGPFCLHCFVLVDVGAEIDSHQGEDGQDAKGKEDDEDDGPQFHGRPWFRFLLRNGRCPVFLRESEAFFNGGIVS